METRGAKMWRILAVCMTLATMLVAVPAAHATWYRTGHNGCSAPPEGIGAPTQPCPGSWPAYARAEMSSCSMCMDRVTRWVAQQIPENTWIYDAPYPGTTEWRWVYVWGTARPGWVAMRTDVWEMATYSSRRWP